MRSEIKHASKRIKLKCRSPIARYCGNNRISWHCQTQVRVVDDEATNNAGLAIVYPAINLGISYIKRITE